MSWWVSEIADASPALLAQWLEGDLNAYVIRVDGADLIVTRQSPSQREHYTVALGGSEQLPALMAAGLRKGARTVVSLPTDWVLRRNVDLPLGATSEIQAASSFLLPRISPFQGDQVLHATRLVALDRKRKIVRVEIAIVPRRLIDPLLASIEAHAIPVSAINIEGDFGKPPLSFASRSGIQVGAQTMMDRSCKLILAFAFAVTVMGPFAVSLRTHAQVEALVAEVDAARSKARRASTLQTEIAALSDAETFLPTREAGPRAIEALDAISAALPDSAWLFRLEVKPSGASMAGFSSDVPGLLKRLSSAPFASPELTAPVVTGFAEGKNRFELHVGLKAIGS